MASKYNKWLKVTLLIAAILKLKQFLLEDIWRIDSSRTSNSQFRLINIVRILILAIRGFLTNNCIVKASALTYYSLISIVPIAAMAFGIAKGFGFDKNLESELQNQFVGHPEVADWIMNFASGYLDNARGGMIAGIGFVVLLWSLMKVLGYIESSFNEIWEVKRDRSFIRKFSDYVSLMLVALLFLISSSSMIVFVRQEFGMGFMGQFAGALFGFIIPYVIIWLGFTMLLYILPNTRVKFSSALVGGILSGTMFQVLQYFYIHFQVGMSSYNAIYGSFAAFPLFLIWLNSSWMIVLFGAELSYATQNVKNYEFEFDANNISYAYKKQVYLLISHYVISKYRYKDLAPTIEDIAYDLKLPMRLVKDAVNSLIECKVLIEVVLSKNHEIGYYPAFDIHQMSIGLVLKQVEEHGSSDFLRIEHGELTKIKDCLERIERHSHELEGKTLLMDI
jgi:membrane protein